MEEGVGVEGGFEKGRVEKEEGWYIENIGRVPRKEKEKALRDRGKQAGKGKKGAEKRLTFRSNMRRVPIWRVLGER